MKLSVFASHWGTQGFFKGRTRKWLEGVKEEGFAGVEMSLNDLGGDDVERKATCKAIADHGLRLILGLYSGWVDYEGPWEAATPDAHLETLERQFDAAAALPTATLAHVNVHAGCDSWAEDVAGPFLSRSLGLGARFLEAHPRVGAGVRSKDGLGGDPKHLQGVSFETHRGRCLFAPFGTMRYLDYIEPLRLTADLSHWHLVSERLFDDAPSFARLRDEVAPCVDHLHARIGSTQQSQLAPEARYWTADAHVPPFGDHAPHKVAAVSAHEKFWAAVWRHHRDRGAAEVLATPEYGPPPYQTKAPSKIDPNVEKHLWLHEFKDVPDTGDVPLVADMSSNYLSKPIDVEKYGIIYGGVQKNIGPAGMAIVIVREDLIGKTHPLCPTMFDYALMAKNDSMYNTPPCWTMYTSGLVFKKLIKMGGLEAVEKMNQEKAKILYDAIDNSDGYYNNPVTKEYRSLMNVPFTLGGGEELEKKFLKEAAAAGMESLKGHRSVGGARASIYNAMPKEGVQALVDFMADFKAAN